MTLIEFLRARLDQDEAQAQKASRWAAWNKSGPGWPWEAYADEHWVQISDQRMQAEVDSKRRIIDIAAVLRIESEGQGEIAAYGEELLTALAQPYADHPDFNPEWKLK